MFALHQDQDPCHHVPGDDEVLGVEGVVLDAEGEQLEHQVEQLDGGRVVMQRLLVSRVGEQRRCNSGGQRVG